MKVLWLCSWYPNRYIFHNGFFVRRQAEAVARFADIATLHAVEKTTEILSPDGTKQKIRGGANFEIEINRKTHFEVLVYFPKSNNKFLKFFRQFRAYRKGYAAVCREFGKPDLVHLHVVYSAGIFALFLHYFHGLAFVISEHWAGYRTEVGAFQRGGWLMRTLAEACFRAARGVMALSPFHAATMQQHSLNNRYFYVPNVVDTTLFKQKSKEKQETIRLLHVSGLNDTPKNITGILNSVAQLSKIRQDFVLDIIGDPFEQPPYKALVNALNIEKFIHFYDYLPIEKVAEHMQKADIFVLFSRFEGLPCVILEAMSVGLPVVATETGGMADWITEGSGRLVKSEDEAALVENLDFIMTHLSGFNPELIRKKIVETCSYDAVGQAITDVYRS
ncbi:MAG: glycosyltransferase [Saprospiraceae bacterium]|nr:glycosyltransferase [Saprospiraceae bacterium]